MVESYLLYETDSPKKREKRRCQTGGLFRGCLDKVPFLFSGLKSLLWVPPKVRKYRESYLGSRPRLSKGRSGNPKASTDMGKVWGKHKHTAAAKHGVAVG